MGEIFITRRGGKASVPSIFGNGSDGDAVISGTVTLPVPVPHQSIVEKQYKTLTINAGAILKCAAHNAGLIIRVKGDCVIHGTIDQSGLAPKTNLQNTYPYPIQLVCGNGGNGGKGSDYSIWDSDDGFITSKSSGNIGLGMLWRAYGGGYSGGGSGGAGHGENSSNGNGGDGGSSTVTTIQIDPIFIGGTYYSIAGSYGGGGMGGVDNYGEGRTGGTGAGGIGADGSTDYLMGGSGGAGTYGGGVILLYVGGNLLIDGYIKANGLQGGNGGAAGKTTRSSKSGSGGGGGGGGGGAVYIYYKGTYASTGIIEVNGGFGGSGGTRGGGYSLSTGQPGVAGGVGSITTIKYTN